MSGQRIFGMLLFIGGLLGVLGTCLASSPYYVLFPAAAMLLGVALIRAGDNEERRSRSVPVPTAQRAFPVVVAGRYHVSGVDRASGMDTEWHVNAASEENARAKAELEGIVVTSVRFEGH